MDHVRSEDVSVYAVSPRVTDDDSVIAQAIAILSRRVEREGFNNPQAVREYLMCKQRKDYEVFSVMFLDSQNRMLHFEEMFRGTLTQVSVYPREVAKLALQYNAAAVLLSHNHPSGKARPSRADEVLTQTLKSSLALLDIRVLDHIIVAGGVARSMAEMGLV